MVQKSKQPNPFFLRCQLLASERHNLYDNLCLIDPPVACFDEESLLNALLYGSDEFNDKINREIFLRITLNLALKYAAPHRKFISVRCVLGDNLLNVVLLIMT